MPLRSLLIVLISLVLSPAAGAGNKTTGRKGSAKAATQTEVKAPPAIQAGQCIFIDLLHPESDAAQVSSIYTVSARGTLKLPRLEGEIKVAGLTCEQLTKVMETAYRDAGIYQEPVFRTAFFDDHGHLPRIVVVGGEVKKPSGTVPLRDGMRLRQAITAAGGFSDLADVKQVRLIRGVKMTIYDLEHTLRDNRNNPVLKDGDTIHVPARNGPQPPASAPSAVSPAPKNGGRENSEVTITNIKGNGGRRIAVKVDGMRLYGAITLAGGLSEFESARGITVIRDGKETLYDMRRLLPDGTNNPMLKAGDTVVLREE